MKTFISAIMTLTIFVSTAATANTCQLVGSSLASASFDISIKAEDTVGGNNFI